MTRGSAEARVVRGCVWGVKAVGKPQTRMEALAEQYAGSDGQGGSGSESGSESDAPGSPSCRQRRRRRGKGGLEKKSGSQELGASRSGKTRARTGPRMLPAAGDMFTCDPGSLRTDAAVRGRLAGRVRSFPHVTGNFPTTVYIPIKLMPEQVDVLEAVYERLRAAMGPCLQWLGAGGLAKGGDFFERGHISLSRTVPTRREQRTPLLEGLAKELQGGPEAMEETLPLVFEGLEVFQNDEGTRCFVAFLLSREVQPVLRLIRSVDTAFRALELPEYYADPRPHFSFAWAEGSHAPDLRRATASVSAPSTPLSLSARAGSVRAVVGAAAFTVWPRGPSRVNL